MIVNINDSQKIIRISHNGITEVFEYNLNNFIVRHFIENNSNPKPWLSFFGNNTLNNFETFKKSINKFLSK